MDVDQQELSALERRVGAQATSPLFAKLAYLYLEAGRPKDALRVCDAGLAHYPFYSTAHMVKGKALLRLGMHGEARRELEFVKDWLPTNPTVTDLLHSVPMSDEQVLDAPAAEEEPAPDSAVDESADTAAQTNLSGGLPVVTPVVYTQESVPEETTHSFGLPSEAPVTDSGYTPEPSDQFGTSVPSESTAETDMSPAEESFDDYAVRKRGELGATDQTTLEDYLGSPMPEEGAPDVPSGGEDAFSSSGFGGTDAMDTPAQDPGGQASEDVPQAESAESAFTAEDFSGMDAFGGASVERSEEAPAADQETPSFDLSGMDAFSGGGEPESETGPQENAFSGDTDTGSTEEFGGPPATEEHSGMEAFAGMQSPEEPDAGDGTQETAEASAMDAFGGSSDSGAMESDAAFTSSGESLAGDSVSPEPATEDPFAGFVGPGETTDDESVTETEEASGSEEGSSFPDFSGMPSTEEPEPVEETPEEPQQPEAEGFSGPPMEEPAPPAPPTDKIEEFAEKLQEAKRITPVIDLSTQVTSANTASADEAAADAGFVTPTLAEIYAKQGWYDDAINAYRTLAKSRPSEKEKYEQRVKELQEEKAKAE